MKSKQHLDKSLMEFKEMVLGKINEAFSLGGYCILRCHGILCVPKVDVEGPILEEAHGSHYSIYSGSTKMYHDLTVI